VLRYLQNASGWLAGLLILLLPAAAQVHVGDNVSMNLNGTVEAGYSGAYGNLIDSSHSLSFGGSSALTGFYYNPNFLSFNFSPYYNQSRANSNFQSITDATGFNFSSGIFSGSHFPGSISYAKSYNSQGTFALPGVADFTTHGNSDTLGINWSEMIPDLPSLSFGFNRGSSDYSIYGANGTGSTTYHGINLRSGYMIEGFNLSAYYTNSSSQAEFPQLFGNTQQTETTHMASDGYGFGVGHRLPLRGNWSMNANRSNMTDDFSGYRFNGTVDTVSTNAGVQPVEKLHLFFDANYSDNLIGSLYQSALNAGAIVVQPNQQSSSHSMQFAGSATYRISHNLEAEGYAQRRVQSFLGQNFGANSYGGGLTFAHGLLGGGFNSSVTVTENTLDNSDVKTTGFTTNANYNRRFGPWYMGVSFSYAQNAQTVLITYMNSYYNYSAHVKRRFGKLVWSTGASFAKTGLTAQHGTDSSSESFSMSLGYKNWITATGSYAKSDANGLLTGTGLTPTPIPVIVPSNLLIFYGGNSYSVGLASAPIRGLTLSGSFAHAVSNTLSTGLGSWNKNEQYNALVQYQFRKMYFTGGYARLLQGFSASPTVPAQVSSFFIGVSRWFNFF
jgi:hypothetical protein